MGLTQDEAMQVLRCVSKLQAELPLQKAKLRRLKDLLVARDPWLVSLVQAVVATKSSLLPYLRVFLLMLPGDATRTHCAEGCDPMDLDLLLTLFPISPDEAEDALAACAQDVVLAILDLDANRPRTLYDQ
ncbi:hypothetical protein SPRG_06364 [Saprolegnia parasitica CBS 223.65]|uniref:Uncharacterized protein n=1 Tax=Saprolegnia parasitica (strain CBS 223.65) TaxID=695850 RepID=A0A067CC31_SAPPC|nr:hypothetical protein SPRG_06364 [Saprolegnia parasitica CBS 223.65]KDO28314.1 hypothetical protein SPRG_06364 [Saprolegnia parasitica CBS 223.65]|eukprot:XP_012201133.1 hypothetical protein SPRG_06364 [Saprolegnia parasitica CBS 223.65]